MEALKILKEELRPISGKDKSPYLAAAAVVVDVVAVVAAFLTNFACFSCRKSENVQSLLRVDYKRRYQVCSDGKNTPCSVELLVTLLLLPIIDLIPNWSISLLKVDASF